MIVSVLVVFVFCCQAEDGIRDLVRSRGLGDVYKRQGRQDAMHTALADAELARQLGHAEHRVFVAEGLQHLQRLSLIHI